MTKKASIFLIIFITAALFFPEIFRISAATQFNRNLYYGTRSSSVTSLQNYLISNGYLASGNNTGYYGNLTQAGVVNLQDFLIRNGYLASGNNTGNFGPLTRAALAEYQSDQNRDVNDSSSNDPNNNGGNDNQSSDSSGSVTAGAGAAGAGVAVGASGDAASQAGSKATLAALRNYGGPIQTSINCNCNTPNAFLVTIIDYVPASSKITPLLYLPGISRLNQAYNVFTPGICILGTYILKPDACLIGNCSDPVVIPAIGTMTPYPLSGVGTSITPSYCVAPAVSATDGAGVAGNAAVAAGGSFTGAVTSTETDSDGNQTIHYSDGSYQVNTTDQDGFTISQRYDSHGNEVGDLKVVDYTYYNSDSQLITVYQDGTQSTTDFNDHGGINYISYNNNNASPPSSLSESDLRAYFANNGISINSGPCSSGQIHGCTNVGGLGQNAVTGVVALQDASGATIIISGGTEGGHITHGVGQSILDIRTNPTLDSYIIDNSTSVQSTSLGPRYTVGNTTFLRETSGGIHWHVVFGTPGG